MYDAHVAQVFQYVFSFFGIYMVCAGTVFWSLSLTHALSLCVCVFVMLHTVFCVVRARRVFLRAVFLL